MSTTAATMPAQAGRRRVYWTIADTLAIARRHLLHIPQVPEQFISATIQPVIFVLLFRYVFGGAIETPGVSYINFLMAGIFVQSVIMEGMTGGVSLAVDLKEGILDRFRTLPMAPSAVLTGPIIADIVRNLVIIGVMPGAGLLVGFRPDAGVPEWAGAIGILLLASMAVSWIGTLVALVVRDPVAVQTTAFLALMPLAFASSAFVPVETMPGWLQPIVSSQPVSVIVDAIRGLLLGSPNASEIWLAIAWCAGIVAVCLPTAVVLYRRMDRA